MSVREEDSQNTSSSGRGLGFAVAAIGVGVGVGAALYYFFGQKEPEAGSSNQWEGQQFTMEYTDTSNDYITTTDTSIYETDPDSSLILSESEGSVEYENMDYSERSTDELETNDDESVSNDNESIDEDSDNDVMSVESSDSDYDDQENQNTDSDTHISSDSESVYEGSENDSDFEHIQRDDFVHVSSEASYSYYSPFPHMLGIMGWQYSSFSSRRVVLLNNSRSSLSSAKKREAFRERSWTLEQCSICFDVIFKEQEVMALACTHRFHTSCILPWLEKQQTCPNCRKSI